MKTRVTLMIKDENGRKQTTTYSMSEEDKATIKALIDKYPQEKLNCVAIVRTEFYTDKGHDGGETTYIYEDVPEAEKIRALTTLAEAKAFFGEQKSKAYITVEITEVQTHRGILP